MEQIVRCYSEVVSQLPGSSKRRILSTAFPHLYIRPAAGDVHRRPAQLRDVQQHVVADVLAVDRQPPGPPPDAVFLQGTEDLLFRHRFISGDADVPDEDRAEHQPHPPQQKSRSQGLAAAQAAA